MDPSQVAAFAAQFHPQPPLEPPFSAAYVHHSPVANPTPNTLSQPLPSHPSYTEMITTAIMWDNSQGKEGGSSKRAIAKYIDRVYSNLPPTHSALLTHHLKRLKHSGQLVMVKNSYQLPSFFSTAPPPQEFRSDPPQQQHDSSPSALDQSTTPKGKPGRPRKAKLPEYEPESEPEQEAQIQQHPVVGNGSVSGKRPRGRPPKQVAVPFEQLVSEVEPVFVNNGQVEGGESVKRRGRPSKKQQVAQSQPVFQVEVERLVPENEVEVVKKRPGRPAKANVGVDVGVRLRVGRGRGRPKRFNDFVVAVSENEGANNDVVEPVSENGGKKRGWPKGVPRGKRKVIGVGVKMGNVDGGGGVVKRRGRKPMGSGGVVGIVEKRVYTGNPRGRPKKNLALSKCTSGQEQELANEELLRKLQDMQVKIRNAVEVIRPHVPDQSAPDAFTVLQQLEQLSTMNVTSTLPLPAPPVMTLPIDATGQPPSTSAPETVATPSLTDPTMMAFSAPPETSVPLPFSMNIPSMPVPASFYDLSSFENQQSVSWAAPREAD